VRLFAGVTRVSPGALVSRAALGPVFRAAREIIQQGTFGFSAGAATSSEVNACMGEGQRADRAAGGPGTNVPF